MNESGRSILNFLSGLGGKSANASDIAQATGLAVSAIMSISESLAQEGLAESRRGEGKPAQIWLNAEGIDYYKNGTPERRLFKQVKERGSLPVSHMRSALGLASDSEIAIPLKWAKQDGLVKFDKQDGIPVLLPGKDSRTLSERSLDVLGEQKLDEGRLTKEEHDVLKSRRLLERKEMPAEAVLSITGKGLEALKSRSVSASQLTPEMLKDGSWKDARFRPYDLSTAAAPLQAGRRHHYLSFVRRLKSELASMGFAEARGPMVELEFWNMDVLFMPQDHPARDIHDVFAVDIGEGRLPDAALVERVKAAHTSGLAGSKGWGYQWNESLARRLVMRSQTTSVSARTLAGKITPPFRMFCIGRVFRPDEIDWKHFIEFNQCEGIVCDENMSFRELLGYLETFAVEVFGADAVKFAPSYFPFTEPSVEMYAKVGDKWTEVGGAGMFRPEMLAALGCKVPVLAWGLGLDRLAMKKLGVSDIRDLYSQDIQFLRNR